MIRLKQFLFSLSRRFLSRWVILTIDMILVVGAFFLAYVLRFNFEIDAIRLQVMSSQVLIYSLASLVSFLVVRPYRGIIRHTSMYDAMMVIIAGSMALFLLLSVNGVIYFSGIHMQYYFPMSILLIAYLTSLFLLLALRIMVKIFYMWVIQMPDTNQHVLIYGAGDMGMTTRRTIESNANNGLRVVGFLDEDPRKIGKSIEGITVYSPKALTKAFVSHRHIKIIIMAVQKMDIEKKTAIIELSMSLGLELRRVPRFEDWVNGRLSYQQIRKVRIQDLLSREPISLEDKHVALAMKGMVVLVTGAAGSIGGELSRQLLGMRPERLIFVDNAETPLAQLQIRLEYLANMLNVKTDYELADISILSCMDRVFNKYRPDYIYHAAAYKHVPVLEKNPMEAVRVNILGTRILARKAVKYKAKRFVMVSTDKAVNPTSIMGVSKRVAELCVQAINNQKNHDTSFVITRFGNVLGSNGSVIPIFEQQILDGGPVTVTHPEVTRYFMTIPEACELVLEASIMGSGGEIFVFDMGKQLLIVDVAKKMIRLSGFEPEKDIPIVFTGLRPGEKLYEELFNTKEHHIATHHPKIMIARAVSPPPDNLNAMIDTIKKMMENEEPTLVISMLKQLIPEYDYSRVSVASE